MWQEWYINHFPGGYTAPDYILLRFVGTEAAFYIGDAFVHTTLV